MYVDQNLFIKSKPYNINYQSLPASILISSCRASFSLLKQKGTFQFLLFPRLFLFDQRVQRAFVHGFEVEPFAQGRHFLAEQFAPDFDKFLLLLLSAFDQVAQNTQILKLVSDVSHFLIEPGRCTTDGFFVGLGFRARVISLNLHSSLLFALDNLFHFALIFEPVNIPPKEQEHTLQPDNHIIPRTPCTEAITLTKWT